MKEYRKSKSNNVFKKIKEKYKLKSIKVNVITNFIKDEAESFFDADIYTDYDYDDDDNDDDDDDGDDDE